MVNSMDISQSKKLSDENKKKWSSLHNDVVIDEERLEPTQTIKSILNYPHLPETGVNKKIALEVGCGFGRNMKYLLDNNFADRIIGIDQTESAIKRATSVLKNYIENGHCSLNVMDAGKKISISDHSVDYVIDIMSAITFIAVENERMNYWSEVKRVLKPGGLFMFLTVRAEGNIKDALDDGEELNNGLFKRQFDGMIEKSYSRDELSKFTKGMKKLDLFIVSEHFRAFGEREFNRENGFWFGIYMNTLGTD